MAWAKGADIKDMPYIKATFGFDLAAQTIKDDFALLCYQGAVIVNKDVGEKGTGYFFIGLVLH